LFCATASEAVFTSFIESAALFMTNFEESLRELVREEMTGRPPEPAPGGRQFFWLFLCVANAAMLIWLLPETIFHNERIENLSKFVAWLGGSVFVSSFVWFREELLRLTRSRIFRLAQLFLLPLITMLYLSQLSIFKIHPIIEPREVELIVDGQNVSEEEREDLRLSLGEHKIVVQPSGWIAQTDQSVYPQPRKFKLYLSDVFSAWRGGEQPRWSLIYNVYVNPHGAVDEVVVQNLEMNFDSAFMKKPEPPLSPAESSIGAPKASERELVYQWHGPPNATLPLRLPYGKYLIFSRKKDCAEKFPTEVEVPTVGNVITKLTEPCVQSQ
jgi:hypothetical protein